MPRIKLDVTEDHIQNSEQGEPQFCAIAKCIHDTLGIDSDYIDVNGDVEFTVVDDENDKEYYVSASGKKIEKFIEKFDDDRSKVKPFSFSVNVPQPALDIIERRKAKLVAIEEKKRIAAEKRKAARLAKKNQPTGVHEWLASAATTK